MIEKDLQIITRHCEHVASKISSGGEDVAQFIRSIAFMISNVDYADRNLIVPKPKLMECLLRSIAYCEYLKTEHWKDVRERCIRAFDGKCGICNSRESIEVHHRTYSNVGNEKPGDTIPLCGSCHDLFHKNKKLAPPRN